MNFVLLTIIVCFCPGVGDSSIVPAQESQKSGLIAGCLRGLLDGRCIAKANVWIKEPYLGTLTDSSGHFIIQHVPPGTYQVLAGKPRYHRSKVLDVRVAPDSVSILHIGLSVEAIPEEPLPAIWVADSALFQSLKSFRDRGGISSVRCDPL